MNKRAVNIKKILDNNEYVNIFNEEVKKITEIPKMPRCEFRHIGTTSMTDVYGEEIVDILVVVENLHEITTFDEKRLNNIGYHRIAHNGVKGVIKYARITNYFTMDYDVVLYIVQRNTQIHIDFLTSSEVVEEVKDEYSAFKKANEERGFKEYSNLKIDFINKLVKDKGK